MSDLKYAFKPFLDKDGRPLSEAGPGHSFFALFHIIDTDHPALKVTNINPLGIEQPGQAYIKSFLAISQTTDRILDAAHTAIWTADGQTPPIAGVSIFHWPTNEIDQLLQLINSRSPHGKTGVPLNPYLKTIWFIDAFLPKPLLGSLKLNNKVIEGALNEGFRDTGNRLQYSHKVDPDKIDAAAFAKFNDNITHKPDHARGFGLGLVGAGSKMGAPFIAITAQWHDSFLLRRCWRPQDTGPSLLPAYFFDRNKIDPQQYMGAPHIIKPHKPLAIPVNNKRYFADMLIIRNSKSRNAAPQSGNNYHRELSDLAYSNKDLTKLTKELPSMTIRTCIVGGPEYIIDLDSLDWDTNIADGPVQIYQRFVEPYQVRLPTIIPVKHTDSPVQDDLFGELVSSDLPKPAPRRSAAPARRPGWGTPVSPRG